MMKKLKKMFLSTLLAILLSGTMLNAPLTAYATEDATDGEEELPESEAWDKLHAFGSNAWSWTKETVSSGIDTVKEKAPGWVDSAQEGVSNLQDNVSNYREQSEQSFWGHFEDLTGQDTGLSGRDDGTSATPPEAVIQPNEADNSTANGNAQESESISETKDSQAAQTSEAESVPSKPDTSDSKTAEGTKSSATSETKSQQGASEVSQEKTQQDSPPEIEIEPNRQQTLFDNPIVKMIAIFVVVVIAVPVGLWLSRKLERASGSK